MNLQMFQYNSKANILIENEIRDVIFIYLTMSGSK